MDSLEFHTPLKNLTTAASNFLCPQFTARWVTRGVKVSGLKQFNLIIICSSISTKTKSLPHSWLHCEFQGVWLETLQSDSSLAFLSVQMLTTSYCQRGSNHIWRNIFTIHNITVPQCTMSIGVCGFRQLNPLYLILAQLSPQCAQVGQQHSVWLYNHKQKSQIRNTQWVLLTLHILTIVFYEEGDVIV